MAHRRQQRVHPVERVLLDDEAFVLRHRLARRDELELLHVIERALLLVGAREVHPDRRKQVADLESRMAARAHADGQRHLRRAVPVAQRGRDPWALIDFSLRSSLRFTVSVASKGVVDCQKSDTFAGLFFSFLVCALSCAPLPVAVRPSARSAMPMIGVRMVGTSVTRGRQVGQSAFENARREVPLGRHDVLFDLPAAGRRVIERRFDVVTAEQLSSLAAQPLLGVLPSAVGRVLYRDLFLDTADDHLQRRGITCRLRVGSDDRRLLTAFVGTLNDPTPPRRYDAEVTSADPRAALASATEPARRLAAVVDARLLETKLELQVERIERTADRDWLGRPRIQLFLDRVHVRSGMVSRAFHQVTVRTFRTRDEKFDRICAELEETAGLRPIAAGTRERAQLLLKWLEREERGRPALSDAGVVLILTKDRQLALFARDGVLALPYERGSGVGCARTLLDRCTHGAASDARLVGKVSAIGPMPTLEVWTADVSDDSHVPRELGALVWRSISEALVAPGDCIPTRSRH